MRQLREPYPNHLFIALNKIHSFDTFLRITSSKEGNILEIKTDFIKWESWQSVKHLPTMEDFIISKHIHIISNLLC